MNTARNTMRNILPGKDELTVQDLAMHDIGKSILVGDTWYTVRRQNKPLQMFYISVADFEPQAGNDPHWVRFHDIAKMVNKGLWGFQHKDARRGNQGWFGKESPRHEGRHDKP